VLGPPFNFKLKLPVRGIEGAGGVADSPRQGDHLLSAAAGPGPGATVRGVPVAVRARRQCRVTARVCVCSVPLAFASGELSS
jgi:hypothetical protein